MVGWHHQFNEHEIEQAPGIGDGQGSLACCSSWGHKELDTTDGKFKYHKICWMTLTLGMICVAAVDNQNSWVTYMI